MLLSWCRSARLGVGSRADSPPCEALASDSHYLGQVLIQGLAVTLIMKKINFNRLLKADTSLGDRLTLAKIRAHFPEQRCQCVSL